MPADANSNPSRAAKEGSVGSRHSSIDTATPLISSPTRSKGLIVSRRPGCQVRMRPNDELLHSLPSNLLMPLGTPWSEEQTTEREHGQWVSVANPIPESLDYEEQENELLEEHRAESFGSPGPAAWKMWLIIVLIGCATAVVAFIINQGIAHLVAWKTAAIQHYLDITEPGTNTIVFAPPFFLWVFINLGYVMVAAVLVIYGEPLAKGSGISEIKCYLNGVKVNRVVRFRTLVCKAVGILFSVSGALPCGKEGPMIHSGAVIASGISTGKSTMLHFDSGLFKEFRSERMRRFFITAGASAGVAAAFGAPIGGLLFAVEEVSSFWKVEMTVKVFCCSAVTPFVLQVLQDPKSLGSGAIRGLIDFGAVEITYRSAHIPFIALLGVIGGLLGALFISLNLRVAALRKRFITTKRRQMLEVCFVSVLTSSVLMLLVLRGYNCVPVSQFRNGSLGMATQGCPEGTFNDMATFFLPSMEDSVSLLIHSETHFSLLSLVKQLVPYYFLTMINFGTMVPSGLFLPSLALGANLGHLYAQLCNLVLPADSALDPAAYALFGAAAMLGGVIRMTISVIVIIMEATNNIQTFYPLVILTVCAKLTGDLFNHGIYDMYIGFSRIPLLDTAMDRPELNLLCAKDVVNTRVVRSPVITHVGNLMNLLKAFPFNNVLVIESADDRRTFRGLLLRRNAVLLIMKRAWEKKLSTDDFIQGAREREILCLKKYEVFKNVTSEDREQLIDLTPYIDQWPHMFPQTAPLPRIHRTFRELGLRYIVIVDDQHHAVGVIARKQLCLLEFVRASDMPEPRAFGMRLRRSFQAGTTEGDRMAPMIGGIPSTTKLVFSPEDYSQQQRFLESHGGTMYELADEDWVDAHREGIN